MFAGKNNEISTIPTATVKELKEFLEEDVTIKNTNGEVVDENSKLATGYIINDQYPISVIGDVNGDGKINSVDLLVHCQFSEKPEGWNNNWDYTYSTKAKITVEWN